MFLLWSLCNNSALTKWLFESFFANFFFRYCERHQTCQPKWQGPICTFRSDIKPNRRLLIRHLVLTLPAPCISKSSIEGLHKTFSGTKKECENKNFILIFSHCPKYFNIVHWKALIGILFTLFSILAVFCCFYYAFQTQRYKIWIFSGHNLRPESDVKTIWYPTLHLLKLKIIIKTDNQKAFVEGIYLYSIMTLQSWMLHKKWQNF